MQIRCTAQRWGHSVYPSSLALAKAASDSVVRPMALAKAASDSVVRPMALRAKLLPIQILGWLESSLIALS
jgi:hypothetical protein